MPHLWIPITVAAALLQCLRTAQQRRIVPLIGAGATNFVRYLYGAPLAILALIAYALIDPAPLPVPDLRFPLWCLVGGVCQIIATACLIKAFTLRNFAVGTTYSKTETVQTALMAVIVLGEPVGLSAWAGIAVSLIGVIMLSQGSVGARTLLTAWTEPAALYGLAAGGLFGASGVAIRGASLSLGPHDPLGRALMTLAAITALQTVIMTAWLAWRDPPALGASVRAWRQAGPVGGMSVVGSAGWFLAMTLQNVAYVRALGQVELLFTLVVSRYGFRERPSAREVAGISLVVGGVVVLLVGG
jgi:drug/metabolite transporter (DMT)-like permease